MSEKKVTAFVVERPGDEAALGFVIKIMHLISE